MVPAHRRAAAAPVRTDGSASHQDGLAKI